MKLGGERDHGRFPRLRGIRVLSRQSRLDLLAYLLLAAGRGTFLALIMYVQISLHEILYTPVYTTRLFFSS